MANDYYGKGTISRQTLARAETIDNELQAVEDGFAKLPPASRFSGHRFNYAEDTGTLNAYEVDLTPAPSAYVVGMTIDLVTANTNTETPTINANELGTKQIIGNDGQSIAAGQIVANRVNTLKYDGTAFRLVAIATQTIPEDGSVTLGKIAPTAYASEAEAEAGTENTKIMTALRAKQAIDNYNANIERIGIGTTPSGNLSSGSSLAIGDGDTGLKQNGADVLEIYTADTLRAQFRADGEIRFYTNNVLVENSSGYAGVDLRTGTGFYPYLDFTADGRTADYDWRLRLSTDGNQFSFLYDGAGGSGAGTKYYVNSDGHIWTSAYGLLHDRFAPGWGPEQSYYYANSGEYPGFSDIVGESALPANSWITRKVRHNTVNGIGLQSFTIYYRQPAWSL